MENLNSNMGRIKVKFMNPLLEIDIYGYSVEDTKRFFNTILRIDRERNGLERNISDETLNFTITDSSGGTGYSTAAGRYDPLVDEGKPLPFSSVERDRTQGEDTHGEGGLFVSSLEDKDEDNG